MYQLAVIAPPGQWPEHWALRDFQLAYVSSMNELPASARPDTVAFVHPGASELPRALEQLDARDGAGTVARLLVERGDVAGVGELLQRHHFDGFIDLAWPAAVVEAGLRTALTHVELGRTIVDIQRVVMAEQRRETESLYELATHDELTHLFNQRYFSQLMQREHHRSQQRFEAYSLVFIDLDDLKRLNTDFGYASGSRALAELAFLIAATTRATDLAVRMGGDEFAVFLPGCEKQQGLEFAERLVSRLRTHRFRHDGRWLRITASCGVASFPEDATAYPELLAHADQALRSAKRAGKNRAAPGPAPQRRP